MAKDFTNVGGGSSSGSSGSQKDDKPLLSHIDEINLEFKEHEIELKAKELKMQYVNLRTSPINSDVLEYIPYNDALRAKCVPFVHNAKLLGLGAVDPNGLDVAHIVAAYTAKGFTVKIALISEESLKYVLSLYHVATEDKMKVLSLDETTLESYEKEAEKLSQLPQHFLQMSETQILDEILLGAVKTHASDIHFQPEYAHVKLRLRIDGLLHEIFTLTHEMYQKIITKMKFDAAMKLNIGYKPQDGKFSFQVTGRTIDVRMSTLPTEYGEAVVCRLLDSKNKAVTFDELGFYGKNLEFMKQALEKTEGMILVTGPTGSGKTTTLYSVLHVLNQPDVKIITLEDPIEYRLENITQSQIREPEGYTFALGLRAILRQDPNVVMVGEIRDAETADIAISAALTGHVMLSTVHTNSAVETIPRMLNMGVKTYLLAPAINTIIAQRLVRKICPHCGEKVAPTSSDLKYFEETITDIKKYRPEFVLEMPKQIMKAKGCPVCNQTGYLGQIGVIELLPITHAFRDLVLVNATSSELLEQARKDGMILMKQDAVIKAMMGITTVEETHGIGEE